MPKYKIQAVEPSTCTPFTLPDGRRVNGCRFYELWDSLSPPPATPVVVCSVERVCPAHAVGTNATKGKLKWADGNWKDVKSYIQYQRNWFRWVNHQEWLARNPLDEFGDPQPMPPQIVPFSTEPVTPGSVTAPPQAEQDDLVLAYNWHRDHNRRHGDTRSMALQETGIDADTFDNAWRDWWRFEGVGDARVLYINSGGTLNQQQQNRIQSMADLAFGPGKVVVEG